MGFREPLDLTDILADYDEVLRLVPDRKSKRSQLRVERLAEEAARQREESERITRDGAGPVLASSCTALAPDPAVCWDVNGYYAALGVPWTAPRATLKRAYLALKGSTSRYLTYVLSQLLNAEKRRAYDRMPLGSVFLDDRYVQERLTRAASREAVRRRASGSEQTAEEVLSEWGYNYKDASHQGSFDNEPEIGQAEDQPEDEQPWGFGYYRWRTADLNEDRLRRWQQLLIQVLAAEGRGMAFAVGVVGKTFAPCMTRPGINPIFFLREGTEPTLDTARTAIRQLDALTN